MKTPVISKEERLRNLLLISDFEISPRQKSGQAVILSPSSIEFCRNDNRTNSLNRFSFKMRYRASYVRRMQFVFTRTSHFIAFYLNARPCVSTFNFPLSTISTQLGALSTLSLSTFNYSRTARRTFNFQLSTFNYSHTARRTFHFIAFHFQLFPHS